MQPKKCSTCKVNYSNPQESFNKDSNKKDGYQGQCKICRRKLRKRYYRTLRGYLRIMYMSIITRCSSPEYKQYKDYGGRGIRNLFHSFSQFFDHITVDLGYYNMKKLKGLVLDRENNDGDYRMGNIRFISPKASSQNRRR